MDVGAGAAIFLEELRRVVPDTALRAVEPGQTLAATCRAKGFETFEGVAETACADPEWRGWADLVASFEVIEHVPDPAAYLTALAALARPGGSLVVTGLCGDGFDIQVLGDRSNAVSPPHHLNFLSHKGVAALVARCGLELLDFSTPGQLDVDIVCNALTQDPDAVADPALRRRLAIASEEDKRHLQEQLVAERRSSHMWLIVRRPGAGGD
jgi:SAM-dependent methyltransferase